MIVTQERILTGKLVSYKNVYLYKFQNPKTTDLIELTEGYLNVGHIRSHSFRSGVATEMALLGFSDDEIKRQGKFFSCSKNFAPNKLKYRSLEFSSLQQLHKTRQSPKD